MTNEQAIEILQGAIKKPNTKDGYLGQAIDMAIQSLEERKQGKWIKTTKPNGLVGFECSNCGAFYPLIDGLNYCPNCGAEMKGK